MGKRFVFLATLLTCSLAAAAEFSTLSPRCEAAQQRSCRQTQTETKSRKWADSDKQPLAQKGLVSNCGPAGEIWKYWPEKNEKASSENQRFSGARQHPQWSSPLQACGVSERLPRCEKKKHMNINEDADEKRGTTLRTLFWINEGLEQGLNERSRHGGALQQITVQARGELI